MNNDNNSFSYTYSSSEQREVEKIIKKYKPNEDKIEALRRLDRSVTLPARIAALILGILGILIFGTGMCFCLGSLNITFMSNMLFGIIISVIGAVPMSLAYPIYRAISSARKRKLAPRIIQLSNEILGKST